MQPLVKILIIVAIVLVIIQVMKRSMSGEGFVRFGDMEFETVPPTAFVVTPAPLVVNQALANPPPVVTEIPLLTEVATQLPSRAPVLVPTLVPIGTRTAAPTLPIVTRAP